MNKKTGIVLLSAAAIALVVAASKVPSREEVALQDGDEGMKRGPIEVPLPDDKQ